MVKPYQILIVTDNVPGSACHIQPLQLDGSFTILTEEQDTRILPLCQSQDIDGIILELSSRWHSRLSCLSQLKAVMGEDCPPIVVIGCETNDVAVAVQSFKSGATDYLVREQITPEDLRFTLQTAIKNAQLRRELQQCQVQLQASVETMLDCFGIFSAIRNESGQIVDFRIDYLNRAACENNQMPKEAQIGRGLCEILPGHRASGLFEEYCQLVESGEPLEKESLIYEDQYGQQRLVRAFDVRASKLNDGFVVCWRDITEAVTRQKQLEEQLRLVLRAVDGLIFDWDLPTNQVHRSEKLFDLIGTKDDQPISSWWYDRMHPDDRERVSQRLSELFASSHDLYEQEYRVRHEAGHWVHVWERGCLVRDGHGQVIRIVGSAIDITQLKKAELESQRREAILQGFMTASPIALALFDQELRFLYANEALAEINGVAASDHIGRTIWEVLPHMAPQFAPILLQIMETQEPVLNLEFNGEVRPGTVCSTIANHYPVCLPDGEVIGVGVAVMDVTNLVQAQQKLRESEAEFRMIANAAPAIVWVGTVTGEIIFINERWHEYTGQPLEEAQGFGWAECLHPDDLNRLLPYWQQCCQTGETYEGEARYRYQDGSYRWHCFRALPQRNHSGTIERWVGCAVDIHATKQTEVALKETTDRLNLALKSTPITLFNQDLELRYTWIYNPSFEFNLKEVIGRQDADLLDAETATHLTQLKQQVLNTGKGVRQEVKTAGKGQTLYFDLTIDPIQDSHNNILGITCAAVDITERKQIEAALRQSEDRLRMAIELAQIGTWDWNPITNQGEGDAGWKVMFGLSPEAEARIEHFFVALHSDDRVRVEEAMQWSLNPASGGRYDLEYRIIGIEDRIERWLRAKGQVYFDAVGKPSRFIGTVLDITEQKQAEATLKERNDHIQLLYETTRDLLFATQPLALIEDIFNKLKESIGLDVYTNYVLDQRQQKLRLASHSGIPLHITQQIEWLELGEAVCGIAAQQGCQIVQDFIQYSDDPALQLAQVLGLRACASQPLMAGDKLLGTLCFGSISRNQFTTSEQSLFQAICDQIAIALEKSELLTSLEQQTEELLRVNRIKDEFLAVLSHELRSPLNPILGWAKLLQTRKLDPAKTAEALATIERNAKLQTQLINDLLDMAKILRGKLTMEMSHIDLVFVIEAAIDTVRSAAIAKNILLHPILPQIGQVLGDAARLQQVVWNLLSNAIKFTPKHGRINICLEQIDDQAQITVSDTGKGIHPDFLPHIFESFRQEDASITRKFGGLGLGLAIARQLVEAHGGTITANSPGEGLGTTFTVRLPLLNTELAAKPIETQIGEELDLLGFHILIVDDEPDARELLMAILTEYGAEVTTVTSAEEVLATLSSFQPHLLISDIGMPDVDGYSLIRQIRSLPPEQGGQTPAIALTAYAGEINQQQAIAAGFQEHIAKPVEPQILIQAIVDLRKNDNSTSTRSSTAPQ